MPMVRAAQNNVACSPPPALMLFCSQHGFNSAAGHCGEHKERTNFKLFVSSLHIASLLLTLWICLHCLNPSPGYVKQKKMLFFFIHNLNSLLNWPSFSLSYLELN